MIWDDHQSKCIGELMFKNEVLGVKLRRDRVVVLLNSKVYVYRFSDLKLLDQIATISNPKALISLCSDPACNILAIPGLHRGSIRVELYDISKATIIKAHDTDLAQFCLNNDGSKLASASEKGTLLRLWDTHTGDPLREFRRGMDRAEIYSMCFDPFTSFLACSSDKGTVHVFSLNDHVTNNSSTNNDGDYISESATSRPAGSNAVESLHDDRLGMTAAGGGISSSVERTSGHDTHTKEDVSNSSSSDPTNSNAGYNKSLGIASVLRNMLPPVMVPKYLNSEWSFAQIRGIESKSICAFDKTGTKIFIVCGDGTFIVSTFEDGVESTRISTARFFSNDE